MNIKSSMEEKLEQLISTRERSIPTDLSRVNFAIAELQNRIDHTHDDRNIHIDWTVS